jgi:hypothetical protein
LKTVPPVPTDPTGLGPGGRHQDDGSAGSTGPPAELAGEAASGPYSLRVVDPAPAGLIETIVGGVTGFYLGG